MVFFSFLFLHTYLAEITKENDYPIDKNQVLNYVWELLAIDIEKKKQGKENILDLWTSSDE